MNGYLEVRQVRAKSGFHQTRLLIVFVVVIATFLPGCPRRTDEDGGPTDQAESFDLSRVIEMSRLFLYSYEHLTSFVAEEEPELPPEYTLEDSFVTYQWFSANTTMIGDDPTPIVFVATKGENEIFVIFRGSVTPSEWLDDISLAQRAFDDIVPGAGFAHEGFADVYRSVRIEMLAEIESLIAARTTPHIFIGGHSLGGSLSVLAAIDIAEQTGNQPHLYTLAGPRVGDEDFQVAYRERVPTSWRVINTNDLVVRFPPSRVAVTRGESTELTRYAHVNAEHALTFGTAVNAPVQSAQTAGIDFDLSTPIDIDRDGVDWSAPTVISNHGSCFYFNHLCDQSDDPDACKASADGQDGCNADLVTE